jgi:hypothetical protein
MTTEPRERLARLDEAKADLDAIKRWQADHDDESTRMQAFAQGAVLVFLAGVVAAILLIKGAL